MGVRIRALFRAVRAIVVLAPLLLTFARDANRFVFFGRSRRLDDGQRRERARRLTDAFESLGITYIKLAQFLTTRPDMVPPLYLEELARLQDDVEPESPEAIRAAVEAELGPVDEVFDEFDPEPLSGASIGQVHRAVIDGEEVAVKVRRPGIVREMEADMVVLATLIPVASWWLRRSGQTSHAQSVAGITGSLDETIRQEMDFERERGIMEEIRTKFAEDGLDEHVVVPEPYPEYTTEGVLTMSFETGVKITDTDAIAEMGYDVEEIVEVVVDSYLRMPFVYQCFQADPHHGNLAVDEEGRVIIYDFGIAERPDDHVVTQFVRFLTGLGMQNAPLAVDAMVEMGAMDPTMEREALEAIMEAIIADIAGGDLDEDGMREVQSKIDGALYDYPLRLNQEIVLAMRTTFGVEGLCAKVAPEYDFSDKLFRFFVEQDLFGDVDFEPPEEESVNVEAIKREVQAEAEKGSKRTVTAVFGGTMVVTGAVLFATGVTTVGAAVAGLVGTWSFLSVARSFRETDDGGSPGPMFATRYNMDRWDDEDADATGESGHARESSPVAGSDLVADPSD